MTRDIATEIFLLLAVAFSIASAYPQAITIKGQLLCGNQTTTSGDTWVKILNKKIGFDDQDLIPVKDDGTFKITLNAERMFEVTPELHIYTDCNDKVLGIEKICQRKIKIHVPSKHVSTTNNEQSPYDIGTYNLESKFHDEKRDCSPRRTISG